MPTVQQYIAGARRAEAAGDQESAAELRAAAEAQQRAEDKELYKPEAPKGREAFRAQLGAGFDRAAQGVGEFLGFTAPSEVREGDVIRKQLRETAPYGVLQDVGEMAPGLIIPGGTLKAATQVASRVLPGVLSRSAGLIAGGGAGGIAQGAIAPITSDDQETARASNMKWGGILGAGAGPLLGQALPSAAGYLGGAARRWGGAAVSNKAALREAEDLLAKVIPDPQERAVAIQKLRDEANLQPMIGGARPFGETVGTPAAAEAQELVRTRGGAAADPLNVQAGQLDRDLFGNLNLVNDPARLRQVNQEVERLYGQTSPLANPNFVAVGPTFIAYTNNFDNYLASLIARESGDVRLALIKMREAWRNDFVPKAGTGMGGLNSWAHLLNFRKRVIDDTVSKLNKEGATNTAKELVALVEKNGGIRDQLDNTILGASGGKATPYVSGGRASQLLAERSQLEAGQKLIDDLALTRSRTMQGGPSVQSPEAQNRLLQASQAVDDYGKPLYTPQMEQVINDVVARQLSGARLSSPEMASRMTSVSRNLQDVEHMLALAGKPAMPMPHLTGYALAGAAYHPVGFAAAFGGVFGRQRAQAAIAKQFGEMMADPAKAAQALENAIARGASKEEISALRAILIAATSGAGARE